MNIERGVAIWFLAYQVQRQQEENVFQMLSTTCLKRHLKKKNGLRVDAYQIYFIIEKTNAQWNSGKYKLKNENIVWVVRCLYAHMSNNAG